MESTGDIGSQLAQKLAANEKTIRDKAIKRLKKWLEARSQSSTNPFTKDDFIKIWKGLHYCMWMQDKAIVQEDLADVICSMIHFIHGIDQKFSLIETFYETEAREWLGLDYWRLDKFFMLISRFFQQSLIMLSKRGWKDDEIDRLISLMTNRFINDDESCAPLSLKLHLMDIYWRELTTVGRGQIDAAQVAKFIDPYCQLLVVIKTPRTSYHVKERLFIEIFRESDVGIHKHRDKNEEKMTLDVDYNVLADRLSVLAKKARAKNRKLINGLVNKFRDLSRGVYQVEELSSGSEYELTKNDISDAVDRLQTFEEGLRSEGKKSKKMRLKKNAKVESDAIEHKDDDSDGEIEKIDVQKPKKKKMKKKNIENGELVSGFSRSDISVAQTSESDIQIPKTSKIMLNNCDATGAKPGKISTKTQVTALVTTGKKRKILETSSDNEPTDNNDCKVTPKKLMKNAAKNQKKENKNKLLETNVKQAEVTEISNPCKKYKKKSSLKESLDSVSLVTTGKKRKILETSSDNQPTDNNDCKEMKNVAKHQKKENKNKLLETSVKQAEVTEISTSPMNHKSNRKRAADFMIFDDTETDNVITITPKSKLTKNLNSKSKSPKQDFISFDVNVKTPPAFVKKAFAKMTPKQMTPKQKTPKVEIVANTNSSDATHLLDTEKRVVMQLAHNEVKAFKKNSPFTTAFSPALKPGKSILKESPSIHHSTPVQKKKAVALEMDHTPMVASPLLKATRNTPLGNTTPKIIPTPPGSKKKMRKSPK